MAPSSLDQKRAGAGARAQSVGTEDWPFFVFFSPSFPNSRLGTPALETPFRVPAFDPTRDGVSDKAVPKREFGNKDNDSWHKPPWSFSFHFISFHFTPAPFFAAASGVMQRIPGL